MKRSFSQVLAGVLSMVMLIPLLAGCENSADPPGTNTAPSLQTSSSGETPAPETEQENLFDRLPKNNYNGERFDILIPVEQNYEFAENITGEMVNDAIYERDQKIEAEYGLDLHYLAVNGHWASREEFRGLIRNSVASNDDNYDLISGMVSVLMPITVEGLFLNLRDVDGINFDDPWWVKNSFDELSIANRLYTICGSSQLSLYKSSYVMYANTQLITDYGMENPLSLVLEGKWTLDKFLEMVIGKSRDLNNDGKMNEGDFFGYMFTHISQHGFQTALDLDLIEHREDGSLFFLGASERYLQAVEKLNRLFANAGDYFKTTASPGDVTLGANMFSNNQVLFYNGTIETAELLGNMESDFVMIPQPKFNEAQDEYYVQMGTAAGMWAIPNTVKNVDMVADILNAHGCLSYTEVIPVYYENALKVKYMRVPENMEVIDLINRNIIMDITFAHNYTIGKTLMSKLNEHTFGGTDAASHFARFSASAQVKLDELYAAYAGHVQ